MLQRVLQCVFAVRVAACVAIFVAVCDAMCAAVYVEVFVATTKPQQLIMLCMLMALAMYVGRMLRCTLH